MIKLENVNFKYKNNIILKDINIEINDDNFVGIIGLNGSGKTTLIKLILSLLKPTDGIIKNTFKKISYVSQTTDNKNYNLPCSVDEVILSGLNNKKSIFGYKKEDKIKLNNILKELNIEYLKKHNISDLSGGERQRVKIAKALISEPDLIVLDEPDSGMDEISHNNLIKNINNLHDNKKIAIIFISHHIHDLYDTDFIYKVMDSKIIKTNFKEVNHHV
ncbi:MAG: ATP-binding cassette domain-containing protein [Bacillales bacterium]